MRLGEEAEAMDLQHFQSGLKQGQRDPEGRSTRVGKGGRRGRVSAAGEEGRYLGTKVKVPLFQATRFCLEGPIA